MESRVRKRLFEDFFDDIEDEMLSKRHSASRQIADDVEDYYVEKDPRKYDFVMSLKYDIAHYSKRDMGGKYILPVRALYDAVLDITQTSMIDGDYYVMPPELTDPNHCGEYLQFGFPLPETYDLEEHYAKNIYNNLYPDLTFRVYFNALDKYPY